MLVEEAMLLVGKQVSAWTAANGVYVGELVEVIKVPRRPWRAKVRITGVLEVACHFEIGRGIIRQGFRPDQEIEVGGSSITPCDRPGVTYKEALERSIARAQESFRKDPKGKYAWVWKNTAEAGQEILRRESIRLETGTWPAALRRMP